MNMAEQIYVKEFCACRNSSAHAHESEEDIRNNALKKVNEFFAKYGSCDIINITEYWTGNESCLHLMIYYKVKIIFEAINNEF
jgi:hypothetical protein